MNDLVKELCNVSGPLSDLIAIEKEPGFRKGLIELLLMVHGKIRKATQFQIPNSPNEFYQLVMNNIQDTGNLITKYRENSIPFSEIFDHLVNVLNKIESLFYGLKLDSNLTLKEKVI
jgi:hypothetical protein